MLASAKIPKQFAAWNQANGAPFGYDWLRFSAQFNSAFLQRIRGPFSIQENSTTRTFEYPWAYYAAGLDSPKKIVEVGGSLSGFQFVLSRNGHEVVNVDPGMSAKGIGWPSDERSITKLNRWFKTNVTLKTTTLGKANLPDNYYDVFFSISVVEHLPEQDIFEVMEHAYRCLKLGGRFVMTVDLFLNLEPFCRRITNEWGKNQNVRWLVEVSRMKLIEGNPSQLYGFPEFSSEEIIANLERYFIGNYPVVSQCFVLQKV
jgi:Methyltransferase domain